MANAVQCVFLIDENVFCGDPSPQLCERLRLSVLRVLCYLGSSRAKSSGAVRWSFKFFDSGGNGQHLTEKQSLLEFTLENFEDFEASLVVKADRKRVVKNLDLMKPDSVEMFKGPVEMLKLAFHQLYSDYMWDLPDISSPVKRCVKYGGKANAPTRMHENYIFVVATYKTFISNSFGYNPFKKLLPKSLYQAFTNLVTLTWIDTHFTASESLPKAASLGILPLHLITEEISDGGTTSCLPLSSLLNALLTSKSHQPTKPSQHHATVLPLHLKEKELCQLSIFSLGQSLDDESCAYTKADILGSLPVSWVSRAASLTSDSLLGCVASSSKDFLVPSPFTNLLQQLKKNCRMLVLQLSLTDSESSGHLCLLKTFGQNLCVLLPLAPGMTLHNLIRSRQTDTSNLASKFTTAVLENWSAPTSQPGFIEDLKQTQAKSQGHSVEVFQKYQKFSEVLTLKSASRRKPNLCRTSKVLSEQALPKSSCKNLRKLHSSVDLSPTVSLDGGNDERTSLPAKETLPSQERKLDNFPIDTAGAHNEGKDSLSNLRDLYSDAVEGVKPVEKVAESLVRSLILLAQSQEDVDARGLASREHFLLSAKAVGDKHEGSQDPKGLGRQRELQLQALLQLELQYSSCDKDTHRDSQQLTDAEKICLQEVVVLLRTFSFLAGALEVNKFLLETLKLRYGVELHHLLREIGEELNIPLSSDSEDSSSENDETVAGEDQLLSVFSQSSASSSLSSVNPLQDKKTTRKSWGRSYSMMVVPQCRRQIKVPKNLLDARTYKKSKGTERNRKLSAKKSKLRILDEKCKTEKRKACKNLFEKLNQSKPTSGHSKTNFSPHKNVSDSQSSFTRRSPRSAEKKKPARSPKFKSSKLSFRSASELHERTTSFKCQKRLSNSPKSKCPRTPCRKSKGPSGFTPNDKFPELISTPDKCVTSLSPCKTPRMQREQGLSPSCSRSKYTSPRTPKQKKLITSGFTPSEKFPALLNTPETCADSFSPSRTPRSCRRPHFRLSPSPKTPKQKKPTIAGFTPSEEFPALLNTPKEHADIQSPIRTPRSSRKQEHRPKLSTPSFSCSKHNSPKTPRDNSGFTPRKTGTPRISHKSAVCSKTGSLETTMQESEGNVSGHKSTRKCPAVDETPNDKAIRRTSSRTPGSSCKRRSGDFCPDWKTPRSTRINRRQPSTENALRRSHSSSYIRKLALDSPCKSANVQPLKTSPNKLCLVSANSPKATKKVLQKTPEKFCMDKNVFKENILTPSPPKLRTPRKINLSMDVTKAQILTPSPPKLRTPRKINMSKDVTKELIFTPSPPKLETPRKLDDNEGLYKMYNPRVLINKLQCSPERNPNDRKVTHGCSEVDMFCAPKNVDFATNSQSATRHPKECSNATSPKGLNKRSVTLDCPLREDSFFDQTNKDKLNQFPKVLVPQLSQLPENCDKNLKTSPILSMRWPQKKRKHSPIKKKDENTTARDYSKWHTTPPPNKKHQKHSKYSSPSTMSIFHLTTSPVITSNRNLSSK